MGFPTPDARIEKTMKALESHNMTAIYTKDRADALAKLTELLPKGASIACGGSVTLDEIGAISLFRSPDYRFFDRYDPTLTPQATAELFRASLSSDYYVMSSNAITEDGMLYNVDGRSNRVAALLYGPSHVIIIAGMNKIVPDLDAAVRRVKTIAAPKNAKRLHCKTPCAVSGICVCADAGPGIGCGSPDRICANYVVTAAPKAAGRITVMIVGEELGY